MAFDAQSAAKQIEASVESTVPAGARALAPKDFCKLWPQAKPILDFICGIAVLIPGLGAVAAGVLRGLIAVGDQIAAEVCKT
ncbi:MAG: hypothetical protein AB7K35_09015 [Pseudorhodoplanes sp.]